MREIAREEIMTSPGTWNPSLIDDSPDASQKRLCQIPSAPIEFTDSFYDIEGNIIVQKTDVDEDSIISNHSSTRSGSRRRSYRSTTRKEKQKKRHGSKISLWDDRKSNDSNFPTHPPHVLPSVPPDPVTNFES